MFRNKLKALEYPLRDQFNVSNQSDFRNLVIWLEDRKIRFFEPEARGDLRKVDDPNWNNTLLEYLNLLECPLQEPSDREICDWLLTLAVTVEHDDKAEEYKKLSTTVPENSTSVPEIVHENPLDNMNFESSEFKSGVLALAQLLKVTPHPNHLITLKAVCSVIKSRYNEEALKNSKNLPSGKSFTLDDISLGFNTGDPVLNQAAKILRLLFIQDLRDMQTKINEYTVLSQNVTANPKTDTRLGKVGR